MKKRALRNLIIQLSLYKKKKKQMINLELKLKNIESELNSEENRKLFK